MKQCWILCCLYLTVGCVYSQHGFYNQRNAAAGYGAAGYDWRSNGDDLLEKFRRHYWSDKQQQQQQHQPQVNYHWRSASGGPQQPYYQASLDNTYGGARWRQDRPNKVTEEEEIDALTAVAKNVKEPKVVLVSSSTTTQLPIETFKVKSRAEARQVASPLQQQEGGHLIHTPTPHQGASSGGGVYFIALVAGCSAATVCGIIAAGFCWYKFQKNAKAAAEAEYPAYGVTGPNKDHVSPSGGGDRKLAHSAQMYHYQHQKQQMIAMEKTSGERQVSTSDLDSEDENEDGDYTVYECPGLAPTGEMEVKNPLFQDDPSVPSSPPVLTKPGDGPRPEQTGF